MLYVNSYSEIEHKLFDLLSTTGIVTKQNLKSFNEEIKSAKINIHCTEKILLYSFQDLNSYAHLNSFKHEVDSVKKVVEYIKDQSFEKIILISYPGSYSSSANLFLQHKGMIEHIFINTGIPTTILNVQAIGDSKLQINNLKSLFQNTQGNQYILPKFYSNRIYTIQLQYLAEIIHKAKTNKVQGRFDVFDTIMDIGTFLTSYSYIDKVRYWMPLYLYLLSYFERYMSPTMLELFLISDIRMFKFRTEKEFGITLNAETNVSSKLITEKSTFEKSRYDTVLKALVPIE
ncbi:MAG TPA: hypothetical protein PLU17_09265 [Chitinophagaceae bacterium]|nr:hypothetical protein [Chitinophagaceae bacterium]